MVSAGGAFTIRYTNHDITLPPFFDSGEAVNRVLFYINFYVPLGLCFLSLCVCLLGTGFLLRGFCILMGFAMAVIAGYVLNDLFTINLYIYSAFVIVMAVSFEPPKNHIICGLSILLFTFFLFHPGVLGPAMGWLVFYHPELYQIIILIVYLLGMAAAMLGIRFLADKYMNSEATVSHLNQVGTKMLRFNHRLQESARNSGEEAVKKDRLRFTSELHDSCGYVFTNIIAISDAAISCDFMEVQKMRETFNLIQNQAREGLQKTRETLHMIRKLQDQESGSIDTVYKMKTIFEDVTGIKVAIETGNIKQDYGPTVNTVLARTIQEAFTNSVRHGQASRIQIQFWEFPGSLTMTVSDNGIGAGNVVKGIGLAGMEERLAAIGGTLEVSAPEDGGFQLKAGIPLINPERL